MRAQGLAEVAGERAKVLAEVDARRADLGREVAAMHTYQEAQEGRVELNIGGYRFEVSVQTLRRVPHTFFDAYFSGRYAQDVCNVFVDRDGEHFGHVLEYMRDGVVSVAIAGAHPAVSLLRALKREFGFYCIELSKDGPGKRGLPEGVFVMGGRELSSAEWYDTELEEWSMPAAMDTVRSDFGACALAGEAYVIGGVDGIGNRLSSVEKYSPSSNTWSAVASLPEKRDHCAAVSVGSAIYVLGGDIAERIFPPTESVIKLDDARGAWSMVAPMPEARWNCAACVVRTDIYVFGGLNDLADKQGSVYKYDTKANIWNVLAPMPTAEFGHSVSVIDGLIYIIGTGNGARYFLRFAPVTGIWSTLASTLRGRSRATYFVLGGCLYAAGGTGSPLTLERYGVASDTWTEVKDMLEGRRCFGAVTIKPTDSAGEQDLFDTLTAKAIREGQ
jgi:hypothetical protein